MSESAHLLEQEHHTPSTWVETAATFLIAIAALLTAWAAFQHAEWSGVQASNFREAAAAGTASTQATTVASMDRNIDVATFLQWLQAFRDDLDSGAIATGDRPYVADARTLSGFIAVRFRKEFRPAFDAWIATRPLTNASAPGTPFEMSEYKLAADLDVQRLNQEAATQGTAAQEAINRGENYALLTVLFAAALVLASIAAKVRNPTIAKVTLVLAGLILLGAVAAMATFPVEF